MKTMEEAMRGLSVPVDKLNNGAEPIEFIERKKGGWRVVARRDEEHQPFVVWAIDYGPARVVSGIAYHNCSHGSYCDTLAEALVCAYHRAGKLGELEELIAQERRSS